MMFCASCFEEKDNWYTNTSSYDGRFSVAITCEDDEYYDQVIENGYELWIYNSAANVADEIIIDTHIAANLDDDEEGYSIKGKFKITGSPADFKGTATSSNLYIGSEVSDANNYYFYYPGYGFFLPSKWGDADADEVGEEYQGYQIYARITLEKGNITSQGKTTIGGNKSDGVYMKVTTYCDEVIIEGIETPKETWEHPARPEYAWRVKEGSRKNAEGWEEHWILDGYRYTGFPEDDPNIKPPIIVK